MMMIYNHLIDMICSLKSTYRAYQKKKWKSIETRALIITFAIVLYYFTRELNRQY